MKRFYPLVAVAALTIVGCSDATPPTQEQVTAASQWSDNEDWRSLPNADLVKGKVIYRKDVENFVFDDERVLDIEVVDEGMLYVKGAAKAQIDNAKQFDVIWLPDMLWTVEKVKPGALGTYVEVSRFDLMNYVWGDFEVDTGEAFTRGIMAQAGLWTPELGYLVTPEEAERMTPQEIFEVSALPDKTGLRRQAQTYDTSLGHINVSREEKSDDNDFTVTLSGGIDFPLTVGGIVKLRGYKEDAVLWFDADFDLNTEASNGEYPHCHSGPNRDTKTCIDHLMVKFEPGIESTMGAEMAATIAAWKGWELEPKNPLYSVNMPAIPLGPFLRLDPGFRIDPTASISADATIKVTGSVKGTMKYPLGVEYFGDANYARFECQGVCTSPECGCQAGANMLPNQRHPRTNDITKEASVEASGQITGNAGVKFKLTLGISPSVGVVTIDGISAGMKLLAEATYKPFRVSTNSSDPCLKLEGKAVPFAGFDARLRWDIGKQGEIMKLITREFDIAAFSLGTAYEDNTYCIDLSPRNKVKLQVTNADQPSGRRDLPNYEVDALWVTRPGENERIIKASNSNQTNYPPDGTCIDTGSWQGVADISGSFTWDFPEDLMPGDVVHMTRIRNDGGGACKPSGTAELFVTGGGAERSIGTADNSQNEFTFTLTAADFI